MISVFKGHNNLLIQFYVFVALALMFACTPEDKKPGGNDNGKDKGGLEAVDLGLSVKWANTNIGADSIEEYGGYYAWGETEAKLDYSWETYKFSGEYSGKYIKYNTRKMHGVVDDKTVLEPEDDVAHIRLGGKWRMPTHEEWTELRTKCTWTWVTNYNGTGINGRLVTASNGNSIFLPAAGYRCITDLLKVGSYGSYWSSSLCADYPDAAWYVYFSSDEVFRGNDNRFDGYTIRPVTE